MLEVLHIFILGAVLGSFSGLIVYRLPKGLSIIKPASHCVSCKQKISWRHNIPIISCLLLRAKCANCGKYFGWRHFLIETLMALFFVGIYLQYGFSLTALEYAIFTFGLITISFIDIELRIIPDLFSLSGIVIGLLGAAINPDRSFMDAVSAVLVGGGMFWLIAYIYYKLKGLMGLGGGDIKLLAWIGSVLGLGAIFPVIFISSILGSLWGIFLMLRFKTGIKTSMAFGPFLSFTALIYMLFYQDMARLFYSFFLPGLD